MPSQENTFIKKIARVGTINYFFFVLNTVFFLVITPLAIIKMGERLFGLWIIFLALQNLFLIFSYGMQDTIQKYVSQLSEELDQQPLLNFYVFCILFLSIAGAIGSLLFNTIVHPLAVNFTRDFPQYQKELVAAFRILSLGIIPLFLNVYSKGLLLGLIKNEAARLMDFLEKAILWVGAVSLGRDLADLQRLAWWWVGIEILILLGYTLWAYKYSYQHFIFQRLKISLPNKLEQQIILNFSGFSWLSSLGITLFQSTDKILVGLVLSPTAAGVYGTATSMAIRITMVSTEFAQVITPAVSKINLKTEMAKLHTIFQYIARTLSLWTSAATCIAVIWIDPLLRIWISPEYAKNYSLTFQLLFIAYGLFTFANPAHRFLIGIGKIKLPAYLFLMASILTLSGIYWFGSVWGLNGAVIANFIYVTIILMHFYLLRILNLPIIKSLQEDWSLAIVILLLASLNVLINSIFLQFTSTAFVIIVVLLSFFKQKAE